MSSPNQNPTIWDDKLTIETPEQTSLEFPLAGVGSRCMAMVLDTLIQTGVILVLVIVMLVFQTQLADNATGLGAGGLWVQAIASLILFALYYGYFAFFEAIWNGQTPGKRVAHLRVIQESGRPLQVWQAIARNIMRIVDQLPGFYAVGMTSALISKQNRRLGDFVAKTVVVHERPLSKIPVGWATAPGGASSAQLRSTTYANANSGENSTSLAGAMLPPSPSSAGSSINLGAGRLGPEEVRLIEAFLERRDSLDWEVRQKMSRQITARVSERLGIDAAKRGELGLWSEELFLEAVARERSETRSR
ncbi:MAG TPA: RDD family protein [Candidatus Acidoferrales bacterium]|nr:RDD family protein [Candidatus Acidoferrales bacterium]